MLYGRNNKSTRTILNLLALLLLIVGAVAPAFAANTGAPPQLVPFTISLLAGNTANQNAGYGGDGQLGSAAVLSNPYVLTVDAVGNVYFPDKGNDVIREINAQTGIITTVAGVDPAGGHATAGCADGVVAIGHPIGSNIQGIAVDGSGNIYFDDATTGTISVVYSGGAQVANFIKLEDPTGVTKSGGVLPGYVYHVAGTVNLSSCTGSKSASATSSAPAVLANDGNLAFQSSTIGSAGPLALDSAGNLYFADASPNNTIRVINTQSTDQVFFGTTVHPGYVASIANCGPITVSCPPNYGSNPATLGNTGLGGQPEAAVFNTLANGAGQYFNVDAYGNLYELSTKGATPDITLGVAYAGGAGNTALANLINNANLGDTFVSGANALKATAGDYYYLLHGGPVLRPSSITIDPAGNLYYQDNHYAETYRIDANAGPNTTTFLVYMNSGAGMFNAGRTNATVSATAPVFCYPINASTTTTASAGYKTIDQWGDGCPAIYANGPGETGTVSGYGSTVTDGAGNLFIADEKNNLIRTVTLNNVFPATAVGAQWNPVTLVGEQELQFHFDQSNLPIQATPNPFFTTSSFSVAPGISDFSINPISSNFTATTSSGTTSGIVLGPTTYSQAVGAPGITSGPICGNETLSTDSSLDCVVNVIFSPTAPGIRQSQLVVTTSNGSVYHFGLTGVGVGGQLAIDGGSATPVQFAGLANPGQVAITQNGTLYVADPSNNRVVVVPSGGAQTTIGTGLKSPMGVAVDATGNVFIADTGNNRIVKVAVDGGAQTVLGAIVATGSPAYTQYSFNAPQGIAVDVHGNVYVADTGNGKVVLIPAHPDLGGATPLLQYPGAPALVHPVALAIDQNGNIFVADTGLFQVFEIPAGGGDAQTFAVNGLALKGFQSHAAAVGVYRSPSGVAVDAAGNLYVSDSSSNTVFMQPAGTGPGGSTVTLNFTGLNLTGTSPAVNSFKGGSIALDANGNLYVADPGNSRVLFSNRHNPTVAYGTVAQGQPASTTTLTITNIGNANATLQSPFTTLTANPAGNTAFTSSDTCYSASNTTLAPGLHCTVTTGFLPTTNGAQSAVVAVNGGASTISLTGSGEQPLVGITLSATTPVAGSSTTITATVSPQSGSAQPTGSISFSYTVNGTSAGSPTVVPLSGSTATLTIPSLLQGRTYVVSAVYSGDSSFSQTTATPLTVYVPGIPVTVTAASVSYTYGQAVPKITGTVTGINPADNVTYTFTTAATPTSPAGVYPIQVVFSGGNYLNYGSPTVLAPGGGPATVTELKAPLTLTANNATTQYGATDISPTSTVVGTVNNDPFAESYTPAYSSILNVGTYPLVPTLLGSAAVNYNVTAVNGTLTVVQAPTATTASATTTTVLPTNLTADPIFIQVATAVAIGKGTPTGTITIFDTFTPIIATAPGTGTTAVPVVLGPFALSKGTYSYTPTSQTVGTHVYAVAYSGDSNFLGTLVGNVTSGSTTLTNVSRTGDLSVGAAISGPGIPPSTTVVSIGSGTVTMSQAGTATLTSIPIGNPSAPLATASVTVDTSDFTITSTANPIQIAPGVLPGGNNAVSGESASTPQQATITLTSLLSYNQTVYLACQPQNPSYVNCTISPTAVTLPANGTAVSILSIQTPATLPLGFFSSELRHPVSTTVLAFLPAGILAFCFRRKKRLARVLWMLLAIGAISTGLNGCGNTSVAYFTPVPAGPQTVTIYACSVQASCTTADVVKSPLTGTGAGLIRSFTVQISIQ